MLIGGLTDCGANLLAAAAATRMRSKLGRYRPFLIYGAAPLGVTFGLLFIKPDLAPATVFAIAMIVHVCYRTAYAFIAVPHAGFINRMSTDAHERPSIGGATTEEGDRRSAG